MGRPHVLGRGVAALSLIPLQVFGSILLELKDNGDRKDHASGFFI
jgi:hypothetical protein